MPIIQPSVTVMKTVLDVAGMYYHAAHGAYRSAISAKRKMQRLSSPISGLQERFASFDSYTDKMEALAIKIENEEYLLGAAYGPFIEGLSVTHILCVASLEAHVNGEAERILSGRAWDHFEKMPLESKWLFFPGTDLARKFDPGKEPFQGFARLVKFRNRLVHYKPRREEWQPPGIPAFIEDLGITEDAGGASLKAVKGMVSCLSSILGRDPPHWLQGRDLNFFGVEIGNEKAEKNA
jgi:hypothetical protein